MNGRGNADTSVEAWAVISSLGSSPFETFATRVVKKSSRSDLLARRLK
jgi:hypothetical protein